MPSVTLATCSALPEGDEDAPLLTAALEARGIGSRWAVWDDPDVDWDRDPVVVRSTWDYTPRRAEFLDWAASVPVLWNPRDVLLWNSDKVYLRDLAAAGVPIVPSTFAAPGEDLELPASEFVVKPSIGAGSRGAGRFAPGERDAARDHARTLHDAGRTVVVQPYVTEVDGEGETALLYFDGTYSHAIRKAALLPAGQRHSLTDRALYVEETITARDATDAQLAVGDAALAAVRGLFGIPLYARVDLLPHADGPVVIELELAEPSLFLGHADAAADRLAAAIADRL